MGDVIDFRKVEDNVGELFGLTVDDFLMLAMKDEVFCETYIIVCDTELVYNEDSGLPMLEDPEDMLKLAHTYFGYRLRGMVDDEEEE